MSQVVQRQGPRFESDLPTISQEFKNLNGIKFLHINSRSFYHKIEGIRHIVQISDIDCLSLNETMLDNSISDCHLTIQGFSLFRKDRDRKEGGVALYAAHSLKPSLITSSTEIYFY